MGHFFISVIFSSCEQLLLTLWCLSPKCATHLAFSVLMVKPLMNTEEFAISCWKHGASRRLEQPIEWYPFALKSLSAGAVTVDESRQDFVHLMLYVDTEPQQGQEVQTFSPWLTFLFRSWLDFLPTFVKHSAALLQLWSVFRKCSDGLQLRSETLRHYGLTGVPYLKAPEFHTVVEDTEN